MTGAAGGAECWNFAVLTAGVLFICDVRTVPQLLFSRCSSEGRGSRGSVVLKMHRARSVLGFLQLCVQLASATRNVIRLGYLTGSQRLPGDLVFYNIPGKSISGAISLAVDEINSNEQVMCVF